MEKLTELADAIEDWIAGRKSRSLTMIARLSDVSYSTVRRIAQRDTKESRMENYIAIASVVMTPSDLKSYALKHWSSLGTLIAKTSHEPDEEKTAIYEFLHSQEHLKVILLASQKTGTTEEEVTEFFGRSGYSAFNDLKNSDALTYNEGRWVLSGDFGAVSFSLARKIIESLAKLTTSDNDSTRGASTAYTGWENLNAEGARAINKLGAEYSSKVFEIASNEKYRGDILTYWGLVSNILIGVENLKK